MISCVFPNPLVKHRKTAIPAAAGKCGQAEPSDDRLDPSREKRVPLLHFQLGHRNLAGKPAEDPPAFGIKDALTYYE